ncbi:Calx-beta domain-containing protein [Paenibacillus sp. GYB003]|uniref:Calx-beta domain-containing protein n=1 Tax=Paenibacillus sp. GYB003 TaxID=2994392 RepID=UPI002F967558
MKSFARMLGLTLLLHIFVSQSLLAIEGERPEKTALQNARGTVIETVYANQNVVGGQNWYANNVQVDGNAGSAILTLFRTDASVIQAVYYKTVDGTATAPSDYYSSTGKVIFNSGEWEKKVAIPIMSYGETETDKQFWVELSDSLEDVSGSALRVSVIIMGYSPDKIRIYLKKVDNENYDVFVNVRNRKGMPVANQTVIFTSTIGTITPSAVTDDFGEASVRLFSNTSGSGTLLARLSSGISTKTSIFFDINPISIDTGSADSETKLMYIR